MSQFAQQLTGSIVALVTPMLENGEIDYPAFRQLIEWHLDSKTQGLVILGSTGEMATINFSEREPLIRFALDTVKQRIPVIVGAGTNSTQQTIALTQQAFELQADAVLLVVPYYNKPTQAGLIQHFKQIAQSIAIPQILYNVPSRTVSDLSTDAVIALASCPNIVGLKDATGDLARLQALQDAGADLLLLSGDDASCADYLLAGGDGVISVAANIVPKRFYELCALAKQQDTQAVQHISDGLQELFRALSIETNPIPVKWLLSRMGLIKSGIRLPLTVLDTHYHQSVLQAAERVGINIY